MVMNRLVILIIGLVSLTQLSDPVFGQSLNNSQSNNNPTTGSNNSTTGDSDNQQILFNPGTNARIPKTISASCQAYLAHLNSNSKIKNCTAPLLNATSAFASGPQSVKPDQLKSTYDGLCHSGSGCEPNLIHAILGHLTGNCTDELSSGVETVRTLYDVLYIITPYRVSMCAQDPQTRAYCPSVIASAVVNGTTNNKSNDKVMSASDFGTMVSSVLSGSKLMTQLGASSPSSLQRRQADHAALVNNLLNLGNGNSTASTNASTSRATNGTGKNLYHPNSEAYTSTYLAFLFLNPDLPEKALCTPCTQAVLASYIGFEQASPYVGGLGASGYLSGQIKLWQAVNQKCGQKFAGNINADAGIMLALTDTSLGYSNRFGFDSKQLFMIFGSIVLASLATLFA